MFATVYSKNKTKLELAEYLFPGLRENKEPSRLDYTLYSPYQLAFFSVSYDDKQKIIMETVAPVGALYTVLDGEETSLTTKRTSLHKHDFYELMYVISGEVFVNIENERHLFTRGSCCFLNRNILHKEEYGTACRFVFLQLSASFFEAIYKDMTLDMFDLEKERKPSELLEFMASNILDSVTTGKGYLNFIPTESSGGEIEKIHRLFDSITMETLSPEIGSSIRIKNYITALFFRLSNETFFSTTPVQIGSEAENNIYSEIVSIMKKNYGRVSRSQLAAKLNYSGSYLNEITKKYSGLSIYDFGMTFCMKEAARQLKESDANISDIGVSLGFSNRSQFYKVFKSVYQMTPAEYRAKGDRY